MTKKDFEKIVNHDPFAPVRLARFMDGDRPTDKVYIQIQRENDVDEWECPTGTAVVHGEGYRLISNRAMHNMLREVTDKIKEAHGFGFEPLMSFGTHTPNLIWNGKAYCERWYSKDVSIKTPAGGSVMLGVEVRNSYDKTSCAQLGFYAMHVACQNQFHSHNMFGKPFRVVHVGDEGELDEDIPAAVEAVAREAAGFGRMLPTIERLCNTHLFTTTEFMDFLERCERETGLVINDVKIRRELQGCGPTSQVRGLDVDRSTYGDLDSLWAIVNAYTAMTTHDLPGFLGADKSARFVDFAIKVANEIAENTIDVEA